MVLRDYWLVIRRRWRLVAGCVAAFLAITVALNAFTAPVYRSTARVEIVRESNRSPLTGAQTDAAAPQSDNQTIFTAAEILTSRNLLAQVVTRLERQNVAVGPQQPQGHALPLDMEQKIDWLLAHVSAEPLRDTRLIRISAEHSSPGAAAQITNAVAENFVNYQYSQRSGADTTLAFYLRGQADQLKTTIERLEREAQGSEHSGLFSLEARIHQLSESIGQLSASYTTARTERLAVSSQLTQIERVSRGGPIDPSEIPVTTDALKALKRDLAVSNAALAKGRETFGERHPKLLALQSENDAIERNIRQEMSNAVANLRDQRAILAGREESLRSAIAQAEAEVRSLNIQADKVRLIEQELKSDRDLYGLLIARVREAEITSEIRNPVIRIVERASVDPVPVRPRKALNLAIGLLLGLLSGTGSVFLLESIRTTIRTPEDVNRKLQLPVLGVIPRELPQ